MRNAMLGAAAMGIAAAVGLIVGAQGQGSVTPPSPIPTFQVPADKLYELKDGTAAVAAVRGAQGLRGD